MEAEKSPQTLSQVTKKLITHLTAHEQFDQLRNSLLCLPSEDEQPIERATQAKQQEKESPEIVKKQQQEEPASITQGKEPPILPAEVVAEPALQAPPLQEVQLLEIPPTFPLQQQKPQRQPIPEPLLIVSPYQPIEQSSQISRNNLKDSRHGSRKSKHKSSEEDSINLELTQKTKRSKNLSITQNKVDSLLYSDATLIYSKDQGFDREASANLLVKRHSGSQGQPHRTESHKVILKEAQDDEADEISARIEITESRECERMPTQSQKNSEHGRGQRLETQAEQGGVFQTQINDYKGKISKIRELKENKKKKLESELIRINQEIEELAKRQEEAAEAIPRPNNFQSRVKISDNVEAKVKAQRFVKNLHHDKRSRQDAHMGDLQVIDKNINDFMEELMKERYKNQEKIKQRKKLEIIDRMKQQEMRKIEEQQRREKNLQFLNQLRGSNSKGDLLQQRKNTDHRSNYPQAQPQPQIKNKQRSPTKKSEQSYEEKETPELSRKKAYLKKIRNLSFRKEKADAYEQLLN